MTEGDIMREIMIALSAAGALIFRNNCGVLLDRNGRPVKFGLAVGSGDLIGIWPPDGKFISIEVKKPGKKADPKQTAFIDAVRRKGGIAGVATSVDEALAILRSGPVRPAVD